MTVGLLSIPSSAVHWRAARHSAADEPTSAPDPGATEHIESLLTRLRDMATILIVTHNLAQALRIGDEVVFPMAGTLVEHATAGPPTSFSMTPTTSGVANTWAVASADTADAELLLRGAERAAVGSKQQGS